MQRVTRLVKWIYLPTGAVCLAICVTAVWVSTHADQPDGYASPSTTIGAEAVEGLARDANAQLGLIASHVITVNIGSAPQEPLTTTIAIEGESYTLNLRPHSIRAPGYELLVQVGDGSLVRVDPGPVRTLRGEIAELPGSVVAGSLLENGLLARILLPDGEGYWLEPIASRVSGAMPDQYVLYRCGDAESGTFQCGNDGEDSFLDLSSVDENPPMARAAGGPSVAELACDADYEYFQAWGSVANVEARINAITNADNVEYERDVGITHQITAIVVRTTSNDPYTRKRSRQRLSQFRNEWNTNLGGIPRDVAQLFTGMDLAGSTIGEAWGFGVICNVGNAYCIVRSDYSGNFSCAVNLSAHELGHLWDARHCSCSGYTMYGSAGFSNCPNQFHPTFTIPTIAAFRDSIGCLGGGATCGDANCDPGEDPCNCPQDCGNPPLTETSCSDGVDNDCDGLTDCDDGDCAGDPACPTCGDGNCDPGEDPCNCPQDCGNPPLTETSCSDGVDNDCDGLTDCDDGDCTGDPACLSGTQAIVDCITYTTRGGPNRDKHLDTTVTIVDNLNNPVAGAAVTMTLSRGSSSYNFGGSTDSNGDVKFTLLGGSAGCYTSDVTGVSANGLTYDGTEPANGFLKGTDPTPDADCRNGSDPCGG